MFLSIRGRDWGVYVGCIRKKNGCIEVCRIIFVKVWGKVEKVLRRR